MCLSQQGSDDEARALSTATTAKRKRLPADERNAFPANTNHNDLILWLAYKEAKALIGSQETPPAEASPENE